MVDPLSTFLVFYGFFVVFYSSVLDLLTTYLPERLVKSAVVVGLVGWGVESIFMRSFEPISRSIGWGAFSFALGFALYKMNLWASGDLWLLGVASLLLAPAFPTFWPFFIYLFFWSGVLGTIYYLYYFFKHGIYKKHLPLTFVFAIIIALSAISPVERISWAISALIFFVLFTRTDVEELFITTKRVKDLEEDDWIIEDLKLGDTMMKAPRILTRNDVALAHRFGKGKILVKGGVPMTPAFSLALLTLLVLTL